MEKYDYRRALIDDIKDYIISESITISSYDSSSLDELKDTLYDDLCDSDITGNISGYSTEFNCEEYLCHNLDLLLNAMNEFGITYIDIERTNPAIYYDCLIRISLLGECLDRALEELEICS